MAAESQRAKAGATPSTPSPQCPLSPQSPPSLSVSPSSNTLPKPPNKKIQSARDEITKLAHSASAAVVEKQASALKAVVGSSSDPNHPRGVLDVYKEKATVGASAGHSGSPTPFCVSVKVKGETKWKFAFESHAVQMEWLAALTDVVVRASVDHAAAGSKEGREFEMEGYTIRRPRRMGEAEEAGEGGTEGQGADEAPGRGDSSPPRSSAVPASPKASVVSKFDTAPRQQRPHHRSRPRGNHRDVYIGMALASAALAYARASSTTIDRFWMLFVVANFGVWRAFARAAESSSSESESSHQSSSETRRSRRRQVATKEESAAAGGGATLQRSTAGQLDSAKVSPSAANATIPATGDVDDATNGKPTAGSSTIKVENVDDPNTNADGIRFPSWRTLSSSEVKVRSHGYLSTKKKIPGPGELYECFAVDCFASRTPFPEMATRVALPGLKFDDDGTTKTWKSPDIFVVTLSVPTEAPKLGRPTDCGPGTTIVAYFKMKQRTRNILRRITSPDRDNASESDADDESEPDVQKRVINGVRLWEQWCCRAPSDPAYQARFKLIPQSNLVELGCPSYIAKYNGKPVLIKRDQVTGFLTDYPELNAMEFGISLHPFPFLFKQAMSYMRDNYFEKLVATFGFAIEGRCDDELPEVPIGVTQVCYPSPNYGVSGEDFLAGTGPKPGD